MMLFLGGRLIPNGVSQEVRWKLFCDRTGHLVSENVTENLKSDLLDFQISLNTKKSFGLLIFPLNFLKNLTALKIMWKKKFK